ncbi:hypothetical protein F511_33267 [Dorcoceras hygrometricum]|uniref:Uncharacterized protein n=1 Tax=Dorcoceras hygrometricum TaxID=472368 RepID=A0A2Z7BMR7_9LAMI|nr:hypothetical protein F511_33267 [Dorcoceras hygrometricum]
MAASFSVNAMQVYFTSVFSMEHAGMVCMFKSLEDTGLEGFLAASGSVYEAAVVEFFANAKVIAGTIVSFVTNRKLALTKEVFAESFGLPIEGIVGLLDIPKNIVAEMRSRFSGSDVPFRAPSKKKELKMEFRVLHDNCGKGFLCKGRVIRYDLGELVKLHPQKMLTNKSVHTYIKKNLDVKPAVESRKQTEDTESGTEGGQPKMSKPVETQEEQKKKKAVSKTKKAETKAVEKKKKKQVKKGVTSQTMEAGSKVAPTKSSSQTSSDLDSCPRGEQKTRGGTKRKQETRLLRQPALEGLTRSARTDSPRRIGWKRFSGEATAAHGGRRRRRRTTGGGGGGGVYG